MPIALVPRAHRVSHSRIIGYVEILNPLEIHCAEWNKNRAQIIIAYSHGRAPCTRYINIQICMRRIWCVWHNICFSNLRKSTRGSGNSTAVAFVLLYIRNCMEASLIVCRRRRIAKRQRQRRRRRLRSCGSLLTKAKRALSVLRRNVRVFVRLASIYMYYEQNRSGSSAWMLPPFSSGTASALFVRAHRSVCSILDFAI